MASENSNALNSGRFDLRRLAQLLSHLEVVNAGNTGRSVP